MAAARNETSTIRNCAGCERANVDFEEVLFVIFYLRLKTTANTRETTWKSGPLGPRKARNDPAGFSR